MNTEKKKDLVALRNWTLSILGIAVIVGTGVVLLSTDDGAQPVEVRPYDPADTLDAADMESPVDWLGASNGKPAASTSTPEPAAQPAPPTVEEPREEQNAEPAEDVTVETITPAPPAAPAATPTDDGQ